MDAVADLCRELPSLRRVSFRDLTVSLVERLEVIVHFLAVLELFKQGLVDLRQPEHLRRHRGALAGPGADGRARRQRCDGESDVYDG